ncbi:LysR substrate-binding domain-containing protein [Pseudomonas stutzeri]|uniref:LysR family transcriptional regulator n=1 Tax=Stutzerimonas stutzeri TaxID=316 RepID=UPI002108CEA6|nr:LysR substrate-binding domain-containing protein [Stutzerimonas stutzeri]MCQ4286435.1 LysR substrate-binding domain-containing protein [Stutzerimonas stutzeri]
MNLKQLRYFVRIAECGSLSKAAEELGIAQPALSQQLRALEDELGVELVTRHSRGIAPNDLGTMLLSHFGTILNEIDRTPLLVQDLTRNPAGEVRLGVTTTAARSLTAPLVAKVHEHYPGITLHVVEAMSGSLSQSLQRGSLDLSILYEPKLLELDDADLMPMLTEELYLISKNKGIVKNRKVVPFSMLEELPLVLPCYPNVLTRLLYELAAKREVKLDVKFEIDSLSSIVELVNADFCTVLPLVCLGREIEEGRVVATPITDPRVSWSVHIAAARKGVRSRAVRAVHKLLIEVVHEMVESGSWPARLI